MGVLSTMPENGNPKSAVSTDLMVGFDRLTYLALTPPHPIDKKMIFNTHTHTFLLAKVPRIHCSSRSPESSLALSLCNSVLHLSLHINKTNTIQVQPTQYIVTQEKDDEPFFMVAF